MNYIYRSYKIIDEIERKKAYSTIALNDALKATPDEDKSKVTKIVYGTLDNSVKYDYYISCLSQKKPKASMVSLLKIGLFLLYEMDGVKDYAAIDECVKIAKKVSKNALGGFVNGVLRKAVDFSYPIPQARERALSIKYSIPEFVLSKLLTVYSEEDVEKIFSKSDEKYSERVRVNKRLISVGDFCKMLDEKNIAWEKTPLDNCLSINYRRLLDEKIDRALYTPQALASVFAVDAMDINPSDEILDMCAAPGGKSVYIAEKAKGGRVVSSDVHEHRAALINQYASRMKADNIEAVTLDGRVEKPGYFEKFDAVLLDAPCSGIGVMMNKRDITFELSNEKIEELSALQLELITNAGKYVRRGGTLLYSTCTLFKEENEEVVLEFLKGRNDFVEEQISCPFPHIKMKVGIQLLPVISGTVGFYMVKLKKC